MKKHNDFMETKPKPQWFIDLNIPRRLAERLTGQFTPHRDGWVVWYKGATRFVCGRKTPPDQVEEAWHKKRAEIDTEPAPTPARVDPSGVTVKILSGLFLERQQRRLETGRPKKISQFTLEDHIRALKRFAKCVGPGKFVDELSPDDFKKYIASFNGLASSTVARNVAYVREMFAWGAEDRVCSLPHWGADFVKPAAETILDERLGKEKSYSRDEFQAIWEVANDQEKLWMALAINGALDNSDLANLTLDVLDLDAGDLDYRRRKMGKTRRVIPLRPEVLKMLREYKRPDPASDDEKPFLLLTPTGRKLVRMVLLDVHKARRRGEWGEWPVEIISVQEDGAIVSWNTNPPAIHAQAEC